MIPHTFNYEEHAEMVEGWLASRPKVKESGFILPPKESLSSCGVMVGDVACGFLYTTNSNIGWVEWVVSNPDKSKEERDEALNILLRTIGDIAEQLKIGVLITASAFTGYADVAIRNGFKETDKGITHFVKILGGL